ncbi:hypothetical protein FK513_31340, partial [Klebsiella pneumoniae]|nr:hypothetical protein [Klebsiella pneumoniae]
ALTEAFDTSHRQYCALGAVKANIGHTHAAAGVGVKRCKSSYLHSYKYRSRRLPIKRCRASPAGNRHRVALRNIFAANIAGKQVVIGQRETFFQL